MMNYYKNSIKEFKKYIKRNPYCSRAEWDKYANENNLFSAFTLESHIFDEKNIQLMYREDQDIFTEMKEMFIIIPHKRIYYLEKIIKQNKRKRVEENDK